MTRRSLNFFPVSAYPADPQASSGLQKCMDVLDRMHRVWPSAFRANELLHGSKVLHQAITQPLPSPGERPKRVADALEDDTTGSPRQPNGQPPYRDPQPYSDTNGSAPSDQQNFTIDLSMPPANETPSYYPPQYNRWTPSDNAMQSMPGSLSTSVLPQQYSTGLVDERLQRSQERPSNRYPQYWSDYSTLGQMDPAYSMPVMGEIVPQHSPAPPSDQPMYVSDQYSLFSESRSYGESQDT